MAPGPRESILKQVNDMFLNAPIGIYTSMPHGRFLSVNPALVRAMGPM